MGGGGQYPKSCLLVPCEVSGQFTKATPVRHSAGSCRPLRRRRPSCLFPGSAGSRRPPNEATDVVTAGCQPRKRALSLKAQLTPAAPAVPLSSGGVAGQETETPGCRPRAHGAARRSRDVALGGRRLFTRHPMRLVCDGFDGWGRPVALLLGEDPAPWERLAWSSRLEAGSAVARGKPTSLRGPLPAPPGVTCRHRWKGGGSAEPWPHGGP